MFFLRHILTPASRAAAAQADPSQVMWVAYWSGILIIVMIVMVILIILVRKALRRPPAAYVEAPGLDLDDLDSISGKGLLTDEEKRRVKKAILRQVLAQQEASREAAKPAGGPADLAGFLAAGAGRSETTARPSPEARGSDASYPVRAAKAAEPLGVKSPPAALPRRAAPPPADLPQRSSSPPTRKGAAAVDVEALFRKGIITEEEYRRLRDHFTGGAGAVEDSQRKS